MVVAAEVEVEAAAVVEEQLNEYVDDDDGDEYELDVVLNCSGCLPLYDDDVAVVVAVGGVGGDSSCCDSMRMTCLVGFVARIFYELD